MEQLSTLVIPVIGYIICLRWGFLNERIASLERNLHGRGTASKEAEDQYRKELTEKVHKAVGERFLCQLVAGIFLILAICRTFNIG